MCYRDYIGTHKTENIYYLVLYRRYIPTFVLGVKVTTYINSSRERWEL